MISQTSDESIASAPPGADKDAGDKRQAVPRRKFSAFSFFWKRDTIGRNGNQTRREENQWKRDDLIDARIVDSKLKNGPENKMSFEFFRNIKKHMHFKGLNVCKSKQKMKEIEISTLPTEESYVSQRSHENEKVIESDTEKRMPESNVTDISICVNATNNKEHQPNTSTSALDEQSFDGGTSVINNTCNERNMDTHIAQSTDRTETHDPETVPVESRTRHSSEDLKLKNAMIYSSLPNCQIDITRTPAISDAVTSDSKVKASLTEELLKLSKYGWYWGPISGDEADAKLISEPDGAFLVRDSSDDRYVLTLSFKSSGKLLHARMEHSGGLFSLCNQSESGGFTSVAALIDHSMNFSQSAVICYSRPKYPGYPSFPVRLTKPVSRFTQVRSLQYLCRFVIRQNTRLDNIHKLPLPKTIKGYIEEAHY